MSSLNLPYNGATYSPTVFERELRGTVVIAGPRLAPRELVLAPFVSPTTTNPHTDNSKIKKSKKGEELTKSEKE